MSMSEQGRKVFTPEQVARVRAEFTTIFGRSVIVALCESHERLRTELDAATKAANEINDLLRSFGCPASLLSDGSTTNNYASAIEAQKAVQR